VASPAAATQAEPAGPPEHVGRGQEQQQPVDRKGDIAADVGLTAREGGPHRLRAEGLDRQQLLGQTAHIRAPRCPDPCEGVRRAIAFADAAAREELHLETVGPPTVPTGPQLRKDCAPLRARARPEDVRRAAGICCRGPTTQRRPCTASDGLPKPIGHEIEDAVIAQHLRSWRGLREWGNAQAANNPGAGHGDPSKQGVGGDARPERVREVPDQGVQLAGRPAQVSFDGQGELGSRLCPQVTRRGGQKQYQQAHCAWQGRAPPPQLLAF